MFEYKIAVTALADTASEATSIDFRANSFASRLVEGIEAHQLIQSHYTGSALREHHLSGSFEGSGIRLVVSGRADGVLNYKSDPIIEEIKSTYMKCDEIHAPLAEHLAQAKVYAYLYCEKNSLSSIKVQIHYYSISEAASSIFSYQLSKAELYEHFCALCSKFAVLVSAKLDQMLERDESVESMRFPFEYRLKQAEIIQAIAQAQAEGKNLFLCAPTGTGKTINAFTASLPHLKGDISAKAVYLTSKTTQMLPALSTLRLLAENGLSCLAVTLSAKEKCCLSEGAQCSPDECIYADGHYERVGNVLIESIKNPRILDPNEIRDIAIEHRLCPFELSLSIAKWSDIIICDYNYFFDPFARLSFLTERKTKNMLLIDEAHNLLARSREMYSASIDKKAIIEAKKAVKQRLKSKKALNSVHVRFRQAIGSEGEAREAYVGKLADSLKTFTEELSIEGFDAGMQGFECVQEMFFAAKRFTRIYEMKGISHTVIAEENSSLKLFCADAKEYLAASLKLVGSAMFFSATLAPLPFYCEMLGGSKDDYLLKAPPVFDNKNFAVVCDTSISTIYRKRSRYYTHIADRIHTAFEMLPGNLIAFFPSYDFMAAVHNEYSAKFPSSEVVLQPRSMPESERLDFISCFEAGAHVAAFALSGGIFSEGLDLSGEKLSCVVVCGVAIPMVSDEQESMKAFFNSQGKDGFAYAYLYSGMNKALQAIGRVIRTEFDKGVAILLDERFSYGEYKSLLLSSYSQTGYVNNEASYIKALHYAKQLF
ncbi:MAG: ATP-dependent DNA helicase [Eubacteriaceae bacterium]|nr:ATP-dependent DNA helicase [Eubacteriaceae bacterium]